MTHKPEWIVNTVKFSERNGGLYLTGLNLNTDENFYWHVEVKYIASSLYRYCFKDAVVEPKAAANFAEAMKGCA